MITFLSSPKPFFGLDAANQLRAISSWQRAVPGAEVILYGRMAGEASSTAAVNCQCVADIEATSSGLPYFNSIAAHASQNARYDFQVFLNCDIVLTSSMEGALQRVRSFPRFLLVGQRLDLVEGTVINLSQSVLDQLNGLAERKMIEVHPVSGIDYFMFRRGMWAELPLLIVGRGAYDNALVAYCLRRRIPVLDGTRTIVALHQFHGYGHVPGGKKTVFGGAEERENRRIHDITHGAPNISDADFHFVDGEFRCNDKKGFLQQWETHLRFTKGWKRLSYFLRLVRRVGRAFRFKRPPRTDLRRLLAEYRALERH